MRKSKIAKKIVTKLPYKRTYEKLMLVTAFIVLVTATIMSIINDNDIPTIIPYHTTTIPIINGSSALLCLALFFIKENFYLQCVILFVQGICTTLTGYEVLGTFLYSAMFIILFCNKYFTTNTKKKLIPLIICWIITLLSLIPFGIQRFIFELIISAFFAGFYAYIYKKLEDYISVLTPVKYIEFEFLPEKGSLLDLADYGLSERQIKLVKDYMDNRLSYKELSDKYYISVSTVKKDMATVFVKFGVKNINDLYILLSQYIIK